MDKVGALSIKTIFRGILENMSFGIKGLSAKWKEGSCLEKRDETKEGSKCEN